MTIIYYILYIKITLLTFITYVNDCVSILQITHLKLITQQKMQNNITIYLFMS